MNIRKCFLYCVLNTGTGMESPSTKIQNLAGYSLVRPAPVDPSLSRVGLHSFEMSLPTSMVL